MKNQRNSSRMQELLENMQVDVQNAFVLPKQNNSNTASGGASHLTSGRSIDVMCKGKRIIAQ